MRKRNIRALIAVLLAVFVTGHVVGNAEEATSKPAPSTAKGRTQTKTKSETDKKTSSGGDAKKTNKVTKSAAEWRKQLTPTQYKVARLKATEPAYSGEYWNSKKEGQYHCVCCDEPLFDSTTKFDSGTGWPSYWQPLSADLLKTKPDNTDGTRRVEVICKRCDAHLGHVFGDGPPPTGLRFCINSASLKFEAANASKK